MQRNTDLIDQAQAPRTEQSAPDGGSPRNPAAPSKGETQAGQQESAGDQKAHGAGDNAPATGTGRLRFALSSIVTFAVVFWTLPLLWLAFSTYIDILLVIFLAVLVSTFLSPVVDRLEQAHIHRGLGILLVYLLLLGVLALVGRLALPLFVTETQKLASDLPAYLHSILTPLRHYGISLPTTSGKSFDIVGFLTSTSGGSRQATAIAGQAVGIVFSVGTFLVAFISILVMAFFLTVNRTFAADMVNVLVPPPYRRRWVYVMSRMGERMGNWVIGQLIVTVYYAVAFSVGLSVIQVPNAVSVGIITGILEIVPFIGGFVGLLLAILVAASVDLTHVIWVVVLYLIVTNVEAHILVPNIYGRAVHLHPFLVVVALLLGARAFGIIGALVAVPIAAALQVAVENLYMKDFVETSEPPGTPGLKRAAIDLGRLRRPRRHAHD